MRLTLERSAIAFICGFLATAVMPTEEVSATEWARGNLVVPDGPKAGKLWDDSLTPYISEPLEMCASDSGVNEVAVRKSAQTGFTTLLLASTAHMIATEPCRAMIVQPTTGALSEFNREKLSVAIQSSKALREKVFDQTSRAGDGSTALFKRYRGGSLKLAIANSAADLRSSTIKKAYLDEVDEYPEDLDGQGDPIDMVEARQESFLMSGEWSRTYISTPTIKGGSRIDGLFEAGDQRYWHMPCPGCGEDFKFVFDRKHFRFNDAFPYEAHYVTPCCGTIIEGHEKLSVMKRGRWVATATRPGAYPSYHFDALTSPFVPWDTIAKRFTEAADDPQKLKTFYNLTLGLAYDMKGDAPDHERLMDQRDKGLTRGKIPAMGLVLVGSADVQMNGIYYLFKAYDPARQTYRIDAGYLEGSTDDPHSGPFVELEKLRQKEWTDAFGKSRKCDLFVIDSGYRSHVVYTWARGKAGVLPVKGVDGWAKPAIGQPSAVDIDFNGKRIRNGAHVYAVGTWSLKGTFYANLRKRADKDGLFPPGYCHFGHWMDEAYFKQITSEYLGDEKFRGRVRKRWMVRAGGQNHWLDCEVYGDAAADYLGVNRMTQNEWQRLAAMRGVPAEVINPDMFAPAPLAAVAGTAPPAGKPKPDSESAAPASEHHDDGDGWFSDNDDFWG